MRQLFYHKCAVDKAADHDGQYYSTKYTWKALGTEPIVKIHCGEQHSPKHS